MGNTVVDNLGSSPPGYTTVIGGNDQMQLYAARLYQQISRPEVILNNASLDAISSPDYSYKSANKNPITSRYLSGQGRTYI